MMTNQKQDLFLLVLHILSLIVRLNQDKRRNYTKQSLGPLQLNNLKDKKAAKRIIKVAKKHPSWYTKEDVMYAKMVKRRIKQEKQAKDNEI